ncbi:hypothetical protein H4R21_001183 [Coemansia helicoidea]|uniref:Uncharacterized protein n=1 Tax=Coemansia helicoidea TaxID=1286919 RepID=A0ACC1LD33_9FUNG|nr:hypothetical protein H4R21_001183 [Coemansia helicoidea]
MAGGKDGARGPGAWLKNRPAGGAAGPEPGATHGETRRQKAGGGRRAQTMAEAADKHKLYMEAVQQPRKEVKNLDAIYHTLSTRYPVREARPLSVDSGQRGWRRHAMVLREDFCGTAALCAEWVRTRSSPDRRAYGVDIDPSVICYGREHVLDGDGASRVQLVCGDVLEVGCAEDKDGDAGIPRADIVVAFNFSVCYLGKRSELVRYLRHSLGNLGECGLFFCDLFGGAEATQSQISRVCDHGSFKYLFRQHGFDVATNTVQLSLGFKMKDGSVLHDCFTYRFRVYTICEVKEAMLEAGFDHVSTWISVRARPDSDYERGSDDGTGGADDADADDDDDDDDDAGSSSRDGFGTFVELRAPMEMPDSFNAYVVGVKAPRASRL